MPTQALRLPTEARQAEIVAAALLLVQNTSPDAITTTDLAGALGLSQGAIFKHFPSKDAVWLAAMNWVAEHLMRNLLHAAEQGASPVEALRCVFLAHIDFVVHHPGVPRLILHELQKPSDSLLKQQVRSLMTGYRQLLLRLLEACVKAGDSSPSLDRHAAATFLMGLVQGLVMQSMLSGQLSSMRLQAEPVFNLFLHGIVKTP